MGCEEFIRFGARTRRNLQERLLMLIRNHSLYDEVAEYIPVDGSWKFYCLSSHPELKSRLIEGRYDVVDGVRCVYYRYEGELYIKSHDSVFILDDDTKIEWGQIKKRDWRFFYEKKNKIRITKNQMVVYELEYDPPDFIRDPFSESAQLQFFQYGDYEDYDLLCFMRNTFVDLKRRDVIFSNRTRDD